MFASFKQIIQLQRQIKDLLRQQITIFKDLGYIGKINDIVSIGDGGRCIKQLKNILKIKNDLKDVPIPSQSIDLVVCYMGLHYLLKNPLEIFLKMIYRILRPNLLFLFREHNGYKELIPVMNVAHMVFNVVTGVDYKSEINFMFKINWF
ncbi:unnamed protein product [Adineta steineri]|uniref:Methyltransferase type 11 domain-containing protein n=1 Tax=Adineta steineri TaxID=433720 RepID=A0A819QEA1_9BILA|nr:unnamed protein product [Adineta steineri]